METYQMILISQSSTQFEVNPVNSLIDYLASHLETALTADSSDILRECDGGLGEKLKSM